MPQNNIIDDRTISSEKIPDLLSRFPIPNDNLVPLPFIFQLTLKDEQLLLLNEIITDPLYPDFCFNVMKLRNSRAAVGETSPTLAAAQGYLSIILKQYVQNQSFHVPLFLSSLIAGRYEKPGTITLSHIFLNSPPIQDYSVFQDLLQQAEGVVAQLPLEDWHIEMAQIVLSDAIGRCATDADIFSVAMLLAKSKALWTYQPPQQPQEPES